MRPRTPTTKSDPNPGPLHEEPKAPAGATASRSRRDFIRLVAAGSAAVLARPAAAATTAAKKPAASDAPRMRRARTGEPVAGAHPMLPAELEKQKKYTADSMKAIRNYALPPGAAPAFVFRPLASRARRSRP